MSWFHQLESVEVSLVGLRPLPSDVFEQRFELSLRVLNPNDRDLEIDGVDVILDINEVRLARGVSSGTWRLPRLGEEIVTLTTTTTLFDLFRQAMAAPEADALHYALHGKLFVSGSPRRISFVKEGTLLPPGPAAGGLASP